MKFQVDKKEKINSIYSPEELTYVTGQRGTLKLVINKFSFVRNKGNEKYSYWRCACFRRFQCPAKAMTDQTGRCTVTTPIHNHKPDVV